MPFKNTLSQKKKYYLIYKPYGMLSQFSSDGKHQSLANINYRFAPDVYPVGRLDADSEGLLLLSNDKSLYKKLFDENQPHSRTYLVQVEGSFTVEAKKILEAGVTINLKGKLYKTKPSIVEILDYIPDVPERNPPIRFRLSVPTSWIKITIFEGKNRQVRKMTAAVGFPTLRLIRVAIGKLSLMDMKPGEVREISLQELC